MLNNYTSKGDSEMLETIVLIIMTTCYVYVERTVIRERQELVSLNNFRIFCENAKYERKNQK